MTPHLEFHRPPPDEPPWVLCRASERCDRCGTVVDGLAAARLRSEAALRAAGEQVERLILHVHAQHEPAAVIRASARELDAARVDPASIAGVPERGRDRRVDLDAQREWVAVEPLDGGGPVLVPLEMAVLQHSHDRELEVREPLTTGTAAHPDPATARTTALLELLERDAFMRALTGAAELHRLPLAGLSDLAEWLSERYRLEIALFWIDTLIGIPVVIAVMLDHTGYGPAVTCGLACGRPREAALEKAIVEAWQPRVWLRAEWADRAQRGEHGAGPLRGALERGLYWYDRARLPDVDRLLELEPQAFVGRSVGEPGSVDSDLRRLEEQGVRMFSVTLPTLDGEMYTARLTSPDLLPLYLDERYAYTDGAESVLPTPHFFL